MDAASAPAGLRLGWPIAGAVSQEFGVNGHPGMDIVGPNGGPVVAAGPGTVTAAGWNAGGYGNMVDIDHGGGITTKVAHLSSVAVRVGQVVGAGQVVGTEGTTGHSTGPHVHFEVHANGANRNPRQYVAGEPSGGAASGSTVAAGDPSTSSVPGPLSGAGAAADLLGKLSDGKLWLRVLWITAGFVTFGLGLAVLTRRQWEPLAADAAGAAAKAAVVA